MHLGLAPFASAAARAHMVTVQQVYAVSVAGPESTSEYGQLYQLIDVTPTSIRYGARTADGAFHDGLVIDKRGNNEHVYTVDGNGNRS